MASGDTGKLVYLERSRRRVASRKVARPRQPPQPVSDKETRWLGVGLFAGGGATALSWLIAGPEGSASGGSAVAALLVIVLSVAAGRRLRANHSGALVPALLAAGSLLYLGLDRLTSGILAAAAGDLSLAERTDVLVSAFCLSIGVWTVSHFLRLSGERQGERR